MVDHVLEVLGSFAEVLAVLHARLDDARVLEDAWQLCSEIVVGNPEDGLSSLGACDIACKLCSLRQKPKVPAMGIVTQWAIRLQTSDFYGPSPPTPNTQNPMIDLPPPPISD